MILKSARDAVDRAAANVTATSDRIAAGISVALGVAALALVVSLVALIVSARGRGRAVAHA